LTQVLRFGDGFQEDPFLEAIRSAEKCYGVTIGDGFMFTQAEAPYWFTARMLAVYFL
jgi:hypothetical protein